MTIEILIGLSGLVFWTVISVRKHLNSVEEKRELFYSNILPLLEKVRLQEGGTPYPKIIGTFKGFKVSLIPYIDSLSFRRLPKLFLKLYLAVPNNFRYIVQPKNYCQCFSTNQNSFVSNEKQVAILKEIENCDEILFEKHYVRAIFSVATAEKSYYQVTRAAIFPQLALQEEVVTKIILGILALREELTDYADNKDTDLVNHSSSDACTSCGACFTG